MKNYLRLSNFTETVSRILPMTHSSKTKKVAKAMPFVVLNSDADYGFYVARLAKEINKLGLTEQPKVLRCKSLKNIEEGNLIVFGDTIGSVDYDYRVETDSRKLDHLDGRKFKAYDLKSDFDKVIKRLKKYSSENSEDYLLVVEDDDNSEVSVNEININVNLHNKRPLSVTPISFIHEAISEEKVHIFDNWVKIGYNQFDIYVDWFGKEFIYVDGNKFWIKEDRHGRKYLTK